MLCNLNKVYDEFSNTYFYKNKNYFIIFEKLFNSNKLN